MAINSDEFDTLMKDIVESYSNHYLSLDVEAALNSKYNVHYRNISSLGTKEQYLQIPNSLSKRRLVSQLRICSDSYFRLYYKGSLYKFESKENCTLCDLQQPENLIHFLLVCPIYQPYRIQYLSPYLINNSDVHENITNLLTIKNKEQINNIYYFTVSALKLRAFVLNE
ncbi:hypothetical protein O3M35_003688 [Rhynocoris fuscipes]|uniref:Reverse transcriptase zinc-binding domain-containing protein n=1 Tax=Rhynocoris fuscipes TaxID=488301 RepID=A0AAW1CSE9_9HEMI